MREAHVPYWATNSWRAWEAIGRGEVAGPIIPVQIHQQPPLLILLGAGMRISLNQVFVQVTCNELHPTFWFMGRACVNAFFHFVWFAYFVVKLGPFSLSVQSVISVVKNLPPPTPRGGTFQTVQKNQDSQYSSLSALGTTMREAHVPYWATNSWRAWEAIGTG